MWRREVREGCLDEARVARAGKTAHTVIHESRDTKHGLYTRCVRRGCARDEQSETPARTAAHAARSPLSCALWRGMGRL